MTESVHVIGASGRTGLALCRILQADSVPVVPLVQSPEKWAAAGLRGDPRRADVTDPELLRAALSDATRIVSCAHARHTEAILAAAPRFARLVLLGSTRKFTQWPDEHGNGVLQGEAALLASDRSGVMLHPTMIYGAEGENNVQRLAALMRKLRVLPLPGSGRFRVQPIHVSDVARCIRSALDRSWPDPESLVIAGPDPVAYADFVCAVAAAAGLKRPLVLPFPAAPLIWAARLTRNVKSLPTVEPAEIRRLLEDKAFDIGPMVAKLGVRPISLQEGLALTFRPPQDA